MQASFKAATELYNEISATNPNFKKVYASMSEFTNDGYQWWQVAELGYDSFMGEVAIGPKALLQVGRR